MNTNNRETGARKLEPDHRPTRTDQDAALPRKPKPYGLTRSADEVEERTRQSEGASAPERPVPSRAKTGRGDPAADRR